MTSYGESLFARLQQESREILLLSNLEPSNNFLACLERTQISHFVSYLD